MSNQRSEGSATIHSTSSFTSFHLASMLSLHSSTTKNSQSRPEILRVVLAARQGPAFGVIPVFIPSHPCQSILFVFSHLCHPFSMVPSTSWKQAQLQNLVLTTSLNLLFFMQYMASLATSSAVERLLQLERPWGLAQLDRLIPIFLEVAFIQWRKWPTPFSSAAISLPRASQLYRACLSSSPSLIILRMTPPTCAIRWAASLPLGSIIPKSRSSRLSSMPNLSSAVVPLSAVASLVTVTLSFCGCTPVASHSCRMVMRFIILVREAISRRLKLLRPVRKRSSRISQSTQLWALTLGMLIRIFLLQCGDCRPFYIDPRESLERIESLELSRFSLSCRAEIGLLIRQFFLTRMSPLSSCSSVRSFCDSRTLSMELQRYGMGRRLETSSMNGLPVAGGCLRLGRGGILLMIIQICVMRSSVRDDKNQRESVEGTREEVEKDRKIKRLTQINRELIEALKQQNEQLTKKIAKQKLKGGRSASLKSSPSANNKQIESIRKELSNAYKQIDMYRDIVQGLKAKEAPLDHTDKINDLETKVKAEDAAIENYQRELKYQAGLREKQEKELKVLENEEAKQLKATLEKEIAEFKEKLKTLKRNATKRSELEKKQHAYFVELEKALRKANDEYYPGKNEKKEKEEDHDITELEWATVKSSLDHLRKTYQDNNKKLDLISRQKARELKSYEENQLKLKEKIRKLNTLRSRIAELTKLTIMKEPKEPRPEPLPKKEQVRNDKNKITDDRQVKKWNVPAGFSLEKGKVLPNSNFTSDKTVLQDHHKYKTTEAEVWCDGNGLPCMLRFIYENEMGERIEGKEMAENIPQNLQVSVFELKEKDYLSRISGKFTHGLLSSITLTSKLGKQMVFEDSNSTEAGDGFSFFAKPNDIPSCFYGATIRPKESEIRICYLGCEFVSDW